MNAMLILYYDRFWRQTIKQQVELPARFEITSDRHLYREAAVVVFHIPAWKRKPRWLLPKKLSGQLWVAWSMESAENHGKLKDPDFMRMFDLTMTYKLDSDVPLTYLNSYGGVQQLEEQLRRPPSKKIAAAPVAMFISSKFDKSGRRAYARELGRYIPIHSYGKVLNNIRIQPDVGMQSKLERIGQYKFTLGFENAVDTDYVTEKFFDPLVRGSVPVYLGAPNILSFAPGEHCFINVADFPTPRALAEYLLSLCQDDDAYESYFAWKQHPFSAEFSKLMNLVQQRAQLRLCYAVQRLRTGQNMDVSDGQLLR